MSIDQHLRTKRILWVAFIASLAVYATMAFALPAPAEAPTDRHAPLLWALGLVAAVNLLTVMPVHRLILARASRDGSGTAGLEPVLRINQVAFIVALAQVEVVGVLGLVLFLVSSRLDWFGVFLGGAALGMLILVPRRTQIEGLLGRPAPCLHPSNPPDPQPPPARSAHQQIGMSAKTVAGGHLSARTADSLTC